MACEGMSKSLAKLNYIAGLQSIGKHCKVLKKIIILVAPSLLMKHGSIPLTDYLVLVSRSMLCSGELNQNSRYSLVFCELLIVTLA